MKRFVLLFIFVFFSCAIIHAADAKRDRILDEEYELENMEYNIEDYEWSDINTEEEVYELEFLYLKGIVEEAGEIKSEDNGYYTLSYQDVKVHIRDKGYNTTKIIRHSLSFYTGLEGMSKPLKRGDRVIVHATINDGKIEETAISERDNTGYIIMMLAIYALAIIIIGGKKGLRALISLILTIIAVFNVILPSLIDGKNPVLITTITSIVITVSVLFIISGFNKKAIAAILGTTCGIVVAGLFAILFGSLMDLSGISEEAGALSQQAAYVINGNESEKITYNYVGLLYAGIILGALGACMDVGMSIASALNELKEENDDISTKRMISAGMNIGKDAIGTMTNTLILAYMGGSVLLVMLLAVTGNDIVHILNSEMILEEILRAIAGSFGLITTIPFTAFITSLLMGKR